MGSVRAVLTAPIALTSASTLTQDVIDVTPIQRDYFTSNRSAKPSNLKRKRRARDQPIGRHRGPHVTKTEIRSANRETLRASCDQDSNQHTEK